MEMNWLVPKMFANRIEHIEQLFKLMPVVSEIVSVGECTESQAIYYIEQYESYSLLTPSLALSLPFHWHFHGIRFGNY